MPGDAPRLPIWMRPEPGRRRPRFSRDQIASAALTIADEEGFEAVTMRRVARELGAGTMTLYHYIEGRDDLLALMDDAIMGEVLIPADEIPAGWREALTAIAWRSRRAFERHPWAMEALREAPVGPNGLRHFEQSLRAASSAGLDLAEQIRLIAVVDDFVFGWVMRQATGHPRREGGEDRPADAMVDYFTEQIAGGDFPYLARLFEVDDRDSLWRTFSSAWQMDRFEYGLQRLLDGIENGLERRG